MTAGRAIPDAELVEEVVPLRDGELRVLRPREADSLLDEEAFEREEMLPYWAELWPSGVALARALDGRALRGARTLELGCGGAALPSLAAARAGARVLASDWSPDGVAMAARNAERNGLTVETLVCSWAEPGPLLERGPWELVLASDVLYERRNVDLLTGLLGPLVGARGEVWLADPGRPPAEAFLQRIDAGGWSRRTTAPRGGARVSVHRLRPPRAG